MCKNHMSAYCNNILQRLVRVLSTNMTNHYKSHVSVSRGGKEHPEVFEVMRGLFYFISLLF